MKISALALSVVAAVSITGCVTTQDLREKKALIDVASPKSSREVAVCITDKWKGSGVFGMTMDVDNAILPDGFAVSVKNNQVAQLLADVRDAGTGSTTKYYELAMVMGTGKFKTAVTACQ